MFLSRHPPRTYRRLERDGASKRFVSAGQGAARCQSLCAWRGKQKSGPGLHGAALTGLGFELEFIRMLARAWAVGGSLVTSQFGSPVTSSLLPRLQRLNQPHSELRGVSRCVCVCVCALIRYAPEISWNPCHSMLRLRRSKRQKSQVIRGVSLEMCCKLSFGEVARDTKTEVTSGILSGSRKRPKSKVTSDPPPRMGTCHSTSIGFLPSPVRVNTRTTILLGHGDMEDSKLWQA